jgi:hypothetical protein
MRSDAPSGRYADEFSAPGISSCTGKSEKRHDRRLETSLRVSAGTNIATSTIRPYREIL